MLFRSEAARLGAGERVLEIGPGTGNLTNEMLKRGARVLAVEKDRNLAEKLREGLCVEYKDAFELVEGDFLKWDGLATAFERATPETPRAKVVANIPTPLQVFPVHTPVRRGQSGTLSWPHVVPGQVRRALRLVVHAAQSGN